MARRIRSATLSPPPESMPDEQHDVLVAAVADDHVLVAHAGAEHARDLDEQARAGEVAVLVVHRLEVVEVQEEDA